MFQSLLGKISRLVRLFEVRLPKSGYPKQANKLAVSSVGNKIFPFLNSGWLYTDDIPTI